MHSLRAVSIAECADMADDDAAFYAAWRHLIDTGLAWTPRGIFRADRPCAVRPATFAERGGPHNVIRPWRRQIGYTEQRAGRRCHHRYRKTMPARRRITFMKRPSPPH